MARLHGSGSVKGLLGISRVIDAVNGQIGKKVAWLILAAVIVATVNAIIRTSQSGCSLPPETKSAIRVRTCAGPNSAPINTAVLASIPPRCKIVSRWDSVPDCMRA